MAGTFSLSVPTIEPQATIHQVTMRQATMHQATAIHPFYALSLPPHPYWQVCTSSLELPDGLWFFGVCWTMVTVVIMVTIRRDCNGRPR